MKKLLIITALALTACTAEAPLYLEVARSEMSRCPEGSYIDSQNGNLKWNYTTGLELKALLDAYSAAGSRDDSILKYADAWYDAVIDSAGAIGGKYKKSNYSLDHICPGNTLFDLYGLTGKEKYRKAMDSLYVQLLEQPRNAEGGFWHKRIYPGQMWLDGLYMAEPFYARYTMSYMDGTEKQDNIKDIIHQFSLAYEHCYDPATGLLRHAWDADGSMFWSDPRTGQSAHAWGRALGWYCMALVDVIDILGQENSRELVEIMHSVFRSLREKADPLTGLWFQVLDRPGEEGNYLEATCCAMFSYAFSKAVNIGVYSDRRYAAEVYRKTVRQFVTRDSQGLVNLERCCEVAGLGGKDNRSGDYDYYIHERVRANDPKGIGPLIWASIESEKL